MKIVITIDRDVGSAKWIRINRDKTELINDPLGQPNSYTRKQLLSQEDLLCPTTLSTDGGTDRVCGNYGHPSSDFFTEL